MDIKELKIDTKQLFQGVDDELFHAQLTKALYVALKDNRHHYYDRTVSKANLYTAIATGEGQEGLITSYKYKETHAQKLHRIKITKTLTKAVTNKIVSQFDRIYRQPKILDSFDYSLDGQEAESVSEENKKKRLKAEIDKTGQSIDEFLKDNFVNTNVIDPNSFLFVESTPEALGLNHELVIYPAHSVWDYEYKKNKLQNIQVGIKMKGKKHSLAYFQDYVFTIVLFDISNKNHLVPDNAVEFKHNGHKGYIVAELNMTNSIPFVRMGTCKDMKTHMKTCVSIIDPADNLFIDLINRKSEYDLSLVLHLFLQKVQKGEPCTYTNDKHDRCVNGRLSVSRDTCPSCNGSGLQMLTTSQDAIIVRPFDKNTQQTISINDFVKYVELPFEIVEHQAKIIKELLGEILECIFGADVSEITNQMGPSTATEVLAKVDSMNAVLSKHANYMAFIKEFIITQIAINSGLDGGLAVNIKAPKDFKILSLSQLFSMLKLAKDAGSPSDIVERIEMDIREKQNEDNPVKNMIARIKSKFEPFKSLSKDLKETFIATLPDTDNDKILYIYQDKIYRNLEMNKKDVLLSGSDKKKEQIIQQEIEKIKMSLLANNSLSNQFSQQNLDDTIDEA